ncbi:hypothetical protein PSACC_03036 [Paramicrosporidium saccamoebae]|uniref:Uncharacterized protein n=1 Tax=Paramicrosporidium saccamoebae TaxID=1246581 RepID=A0A2H9TH94_9FUNG|nr:hypothetical protein PSACC_03036 [Paramicrosporidium saccamoebae]
MFLDKWSYTAVRTSQHQELAQDYEKVRNYVNMHLHMADPVSLMQAVVKESIEYETPIDAYTLGWTWHPNYSMCEDESRAAAQLVSHMLQKSKFNVNKLLEIASTLRCTLLPEHDVTASLLYQAMDVPLKDKKLLGIMAPDSSRMAKRALEYYLAAIRAHMLAGMRESAVHTLVEGYPRFQGDPRYQEELLHLCKSDLSLSADTMTFQIINRVGYKRVNQVPADIQGAIHNILSLAVAKRMRDVHELMPKETRRLVSQGASGRDSKRNENIDTLLDVFEMVACTLENIIDDIYAALSSAQKQKRKLDICAVMAVDQSEIVCSLSG